VGHIYEQVPLAVAVNLLLAAIVAFTLWGHVPPGWLLPWAGLVAAVNAGRLALAGAYDRARDRQPRTWRQRHLVGLVLSSGLWGLAAPLFLPGLPSLEAAALVVALAGIAAGALPLNGAIPHVYFSHLALTVAPAAVTFAWLGGRTYLMLALMAIVYAASLVGAGRRYGRSLESANELAARLHAANRALEQRASHDPLTGLWNRQRFESALDAEIDRISRYASMCSLIMLDIDRFKPINDSYGHATGDEVLARIGELLAAEIRRPDAVARWGGEEFMVLLPQTAADAAMDVAERLRRRVAETDVEGPGRITISLGVTSSSAPEERSELLKRLDDALYLAKQSGRNCVRIVSEPERMAGRNGGREGSARPTRRP
jgi:diguanylate cyclase (GGDEF)-like protein